MHVCNFTRGLALEPRPSVSEALPATAGGRSIYQEVMGAEFDRLHPMIQRRFGFRCADQVASIGRGVMSSVKRGPLFTYPFLLCGSWRRIMFPEQGTNVPFTVENYAYIDRLGRESVTWIRKFETRTPRRFDAYMLKDPERNLIVDYLGTHQHLAVDLHLSVARNGGLRLISGEQRFYEGWLGFRFPMAFTGVADVCEWYDDELEKYRIKVNITNDTWGFLFGYEGTFEVEWRDVPLNYVPEELLPRRVEWRL
jgi:hypothetical protein